MAIIRHTPEHIKLLARLMSVMNLGKLLLIMILRHILLL